MGVESSLNYKSLRLFPSNNANNSVKYLNFGMLSPEAFETVSDLYISFESLTDDLRALNGQNMMKSKDCSKNYVRKKD